MLNIVCIVSTSGETTVVRGKLPLHKNLRLFFYEFYVIRMVKQFVWKLQSLQTLLFIVRCNDKYALHLDFTHKSHTSVEKKF